MSRPDIARLVKYSKRHFKSKRLKKKQIVRLKQSYIKICKKYKIVSMSLTLSGPISPKEEWGCRIAIVGRGLELIYKDILV